MFKKTTDVFEGIYSELIFPFFRFCLKFYWIIFKIKRHSNDVSWEKIIKNYSNYNEAGTSIKNYNK